MIFETLFSPGLWLMRSMRLGAKLLLLALVLLATPLVVLLQYVFSGGGSTAVAWLSGICVLLALYGLLAFFMSFTQDLGQVRQAMEQLVKGDLRLRLVLRGSDELAGLAAATQHLSLIHI